MGKLHFVTQMEYFVTRTIHLCIWKPSPPYRLQHSETKMLRPQTGRAPRVSGRHFRLTDCSILKQKCFVPKRDAPFDEANAVSPKWNAAFDETNAVSPKWDAKVGTKNAYSLTGTRHWAVKMSFPQKMMRSHKKKT